MLSGITLLADGDAELTCKPEDFCFALPVRARRASARERLPSYREPTSRNPEVAHMETCGNPYARAPFRLLPIRAPRQAVLRTSSRLAPSRITNRPCDLPVEKTRDASNRCLPPKRTACTRTSRVPGSARNFRCGDTPRTLRLRAVGPGDRTFHDVRMSASADRHRTRALEPTVPCGLRTRAWACYSHGVDAIEPLTSLSRPSASSPRLIPLRGCCNLAGRPSFGGVGSGRRMRRAPRPP